RAAPQREAESSLAHQKGTHPMAMPTNTFATYEAIGNREDLSDVIYRIDPTDTPFMTGIEREKATAVTHPSHTQPLPAPPTPTTARTDQPPAQSRRRRPHPHHADGAARQHLPDLLQGAARQRHAAGGGARRPRRRARLPTGNTRVPDAAQREVMRALTRLRRVVVPRPEERREATRLEGRGAPHSARSKARLSPPLPRG